ncbi:MAG: hypothetical protein IKX19_00865, partial [Clostridia bacterium]|nr:hypothetical protein [Clostridia bacterium]
CAVVTYTYAGSPAEKAGLRRGDVVLTVDGAEMTPDGPEFDKFVALVQSPTEARMLPAIYNKYLREEILPYVRGEKPWEDCWKSFVNTMELYKDE